MSRLEEGMVVQHFKRETIQDTDSAQYLYLILAFAKHTETEEKLVIYQSLEDGDKICARPYDMFMGKVDTEKYPNIKQKYRFEEVPEEVWKNHY